VCVSTTCLVSDSVDDDLGCRGVVKKHVVVKGALAIVEDELCKNEIRLTGVMHVKAHLIDPVVDARCGEGKVLQIPG
jgi:hypothetical protein